jgi:hypothetical protein
MVLVTLLLDSSESATLQHRAEQEGCSVEQVVHDALRAYLEQCETLSWTDLASRPPLFADTRTEIDDAIRASDRGWAREGSG